MSCFLGIDTSNYTTSVALFDTEKGIVGNVRKLLPVKSGELGLRQSDAVFQHTLALPGLLTELFAADCPTITAVGVSVAPCDADGSYMPCFITGKGTADSIAAVMGIPVRYFSHQAGHIAAAALSAGETSLLRREFIAFHVSGGTTQAVRVLPCEKGKMRTELLAGSLDLKAGQAVDRVGKMLSLAFPAGPALEKTAYESKKRYTIKPYMRDGNVSLSGLENKCAAMLQAGEEACDIARYCLDYISAALLGMIRECTREYPSLPLLFSGGVLSDLIIRNAIAAEYNAVFAEPAFSSDNAAGIAYLASL